MAECPLVGLCSINVGINLTLGFVVKRVRVVSYCKEIKVSYLGSVSKCFFTGTRTIGE